ncbi:MAG: hypothetical protein ACM3JG_06200 [Thiohalocapsa sp.]
MPSINACRSTIHSALCRQSVDDAQAWVERGPPGDLLPIDRADDFTILETLARPDGVVMQALLTLVRD